MALVQAKGRLESAFSGRYFGSATTTANGYGERGNFTGWRNMIAGEGMRAPQVAVPVGHLAPSAWFLPQVSGGMSMQADAAGGLSADLIPSYPMAIDMTGLGDLDAIAALAVAMALALDGAGDLTAQIEGRLDTAVDLTGTGDMTADLSALGNMVIAMLGAGDLEATIAAYGDMTVDIVVTGTGLSTANVGQAVWDALVAASNVPGSRGEELTKALRAAKLAAALGA